MEICIHAWSPYLEKDEGCLERVMQMTATKMVHGLKGLTYEVRLKRLGLYFLQRRRLRGELTGTFKILTGKECIGKREFFSLSVTTKPERPRSEAVQAKITSSDTPEILQPADHRHLKQVTAGSGGIDIHQHL